MPDKITQADVQTLAATKALADAGSASETRSTTGVAGQTMLPCPGSPPVWVQVQLLDESSRPVADRRCRITLPSGKVTAGKTDTRGLLTVRGIVGTEGELCVVSFPDLDGSAWDWDSQSGQREGA